jgi:hypothetical protein
MLEKWDVAFLFRVVGRAWRRCSNMSGIIFNRLINFAFRYENEKRPKL